MNQFETAEKAFEYFLSFYNVERVVGPTVFRLDRLHKILSHFDNPHNKVETYHVAGSKGKGSVSTMLSSILKEAGNKTGLYTSPHIESYKERITLAGIQFEDIDYISNIIKIKEYLENQGLLIIKEFGEPTFFELATILAFQLFYEKNCSRTVLEVGLGGRLDSTNVVNPRASIITTIELEHTEYLGDTIKKIALEKAGIIKRAKPVFISRQKNDCNDVFYNKAKELNSPIYFIENEIEKINTSISTSGTKIEISYNNKKLFPRPLITTIPLIGNIQADNAALAAFVCKTMEQDISLDTIEKGLQNATMKSRFEIISHDPMIIIDGAHTENSIENTINTFTELFTEKPIILFSCAHDKNSFAMAKLLKNKNSKIIITVPGNFKQSNPQKIVSDFSANEIETELELDTEKAVTKSVNFARENNIPLLITGSFYLCAIARNIVKKN